MTVQHNRPAPGAADWLVTAADQALRTLAGAPAGNRTSPAEATEPEVMQPAERRHAARLMRVNHAGEVAAQALYHGQALTAKLDEIKDSMEQSAAEETDHLAWCDQRLTELGGHRSMLNPLWYAGSFAMGALAGIAGDRWSLGFVAETERQVVRHLDSHMDRLPAGDQRSRAILGQMRVDETEHGRKAADAGGRDLPSPIPQIMTAVSKLMTRTAYWI